MQNEQLKAVIVKLGEMNLKDLKIFWQKYFESEPPGLSRDFLRRRIIFLLQEREFGGVSDFISEKVFAIGLKGPRVINSKGFKVGMTFSRTWQGCHYEIIAVEDGFKMDGKKYRSLSGAAFAITGTQWSGKVFWRIK